MNQILASAMSLVVILSAGSAWADTTTPVPSGSVGDGYTGPLNTITANPLGLAFGALNFEYERAASERLSWFVGPSYWSFSTSLNGGSEGKTAAYGLSAGLRYFLTGRAPEGFFLSPGVSASYVTTSYGSGADAVGYDVSGIAGYTWLFGDVVDLSIGLGAAYRHAEVEVAGRTLGFSGVVPTGRLAIGAAF